MYFENDNFTIYYEKIGSGNKTLIILPGWGFTRPTFNYLIDILKDQYTIYIFDYPEFGNSKVKKENLTIFDYANVIYEIIVSLNIDSFDVIAHSFGGRIISILSSYNLNINKIILMDVAGIKSFSIKRLFRTYYYKILRKVSCIFPRKLKMKFNTYMLNKYSSSDYSLLPNYMKKTFQNIINQDLRNYYKRISNRTLIIWGKFDNATPVNNAYKLRKYIKNSELIIFSFGTHFVYLDYPLLVLNIISEFLK